MDWQAEIEEKGFVVLLGLVSHKALDQFINGFNALAPRRSRAGVRHTLGLGPGEALARLLQVRELAFRATLFAQTRAANRLVVWHQDTASSDSIAHPLRLALA